MKFWVVDQNIGKTKKPTADIKDLIFRRCYGASTNLIVLP